MARRTEDVKRDIEQTRDELGSTLEAIGDRVAPKKVVGRVKTNVSDKVDDVKERISPVRLVRRGTDGVRNSLRSTRSAVGGSNGATSAGFELPSGRARANGSGRRPAKELASRAGDVAGSATSRAGDAAGTVAARAGDAAGTVASRAGDAAGTVADHALAAPSTLRDRARENPLVTGLLAFGGGFLIASRLPSSERERQITGRAREHLVPVKQHALEAGRGVADDLKSVAQESLDEVRQRAVGAAGQVKEEALVLADKVKVEARSSADQVKQEASVATDDVQTQARAATRRVKARTEHAGATSTGRTRARRSPAGAAGRDSSPRRSTRTTG